MLFHPHREQHQHLDDSLLLLPVTLTLSRTLAATASAVVSNLAAAIKDTLDILLRLCRVIFRRSSSSSSSPSLDPTFY